MNTGVSKQNATPTAEKASETHETLDQTTSANLLTAMHGEAFAYVKYLLYAEHARKSGNKELAESCLRRRPTLSVLSISLKKPNCAD